MNTLTVTNGTVIFNGFEELGPDATFLFHRDKIAIMPLKLPNDRTRYYAPVESGKINDSELASRVVKVIGNGPARFILVDGTYLLTD